MDWKILAASFAALLIVSSVLLGGFGIGNFFSDIINTIGGFLGSSPFGGVSSLDSGVLAVSVVFYPSEFSLNTEHGVNMSIGPMDFEMFDGEIVVDYQNNIMTLRPKNIELSIDLPLQEIVIEDIKLSKISVEETGFEISNEESGKTIGEGDVEIFDFSGKFIIDTDKIEFNGTVSGLSVETGESQWELK